MIRLCRWRCLVLLFAVAPLSMLRAQENISPREAADRLILDNARVYLSGDNIPAYAAAVLHCGENRFSHGGLVRIDRRLQTTAESQFNIGQNANSMLASIAARYVERGLVDFDATIAELWPAAGQVAPDKVAITLGQLLGHRSGMQSFTSAEEHQRMPPFSGTPSDMRRQAAMWLLEQPLEREPGSGPSYSSAGYVVAGVLLARVSGRSLELMFREELFEPLGLTGRVGSAQRVEEPFGHYLEDGALRVNLSLEPSVPVFLDAAGSVSISAPDYAAYLQAHLCGLQGVETGYLSARTIQQMHRLGRDNADAYGWSSADIAGAQVSLHLGDTGDFAAFVALAPEQDFALLAMVNVGGEAAAPGGTWLVESLITASRAGPVAAPEGAENLPDALE